MYRERAEAETQQPKTKGFTADNYERIPPRGQVELHRTFAAHRNAIQRTPSSSRYSDLVTFILFRCLFSLACGYHVTLVILTIYMARPIVFGCRLSLDRPPITRYERTQVFYQGLMLMLRKSGHKSTPGFFFTPLILLVYEELRSPNDWMHLEFWLMEDGLKNLSDKVLTAALNGLLTTVRAADAAAIHLAQLTWTSLSFMREFNNSARLNITR
ncbi:hypothetical protein HBH67_027710 [Parastagonospora nodorum]|nr:hypothetical protein HBH67_027710 [Parastagonospora nodorum]